MRGIIGILLRPALRVSQGWLDGAEAAVPRPADQPRVYAPGAGGVRILVIGNGVALGTGVRSHELALPGHLARAFSARTGSATEVVLVAEPRLSLARLADALRADQPQRYDAVVVVTGSAEARQLLSPHHWRRRLTDALAEIRSLMAPGASLVVTGLPARRVGRGLPRTIARLVDDHAATMDRITAQCCELVDGAAFAPLETPPHRARSASHDFARWGDTVATQLSSTRPSSTRSGGATLDEERRQAAVDRLDLGAASASLNRIVEMARRIFGTETALFTVLDRDLQRHAARSGTELQQIPRSDSFCQFTILDPDGMIVGDALLDERFSDNPLVVGDPHVRFYAGFPVDSPDGERVGALCVFDSRPRRAEDVDMSLLRELSHLVQTELWRHLPLVATATPQLRPIRRPWTLPALRPFARGLEAESRGV